MKVTSLLFISTFTLTLIFSGCNGGKNGPNKNNIGVSATNKCVYNPDADTIYSDWSKENIVVNQWLSDPDNLHPTNGRSASRSWILQYTSSYLLRNDPISLTIIPDLAEDFPKVSEDALRYTYELRKNAKWDDGSDITGEDIVFTMKANTCALTNNPNAKPYFENISAIEYDPSTPRMLTMVMKKKYILNEIFVTDYPIMQRSFYDKQNVLSHYSFDQLRDQALLSNAPADIADWAKEFNDPKYASDINFFDGSGPYKVAAWAPKEQLILEKKKDHWTSKIKDPNPYMSAYPDKIIFKPNKDDNSQMLEFKSQHYDASVWLSTEIVMELLKDKDFVRNYNTEFTDTYAYNYAGMNMKPEGVHKKIFTDEKTRRAMAMLTPVDDMISVISHGYAKRQVTFVSPLKEEYNKELAPIPYDLNGAMQLLDEAGWKDTDGDNIRDKVVDGEKIPLSFELMYVSGAKLTDQMAKMIGQSIEQAGIKVTLASIEFGTFYQRAQQHDFDMMLGAWSGGPTAEDYTQLWSTSAFASGGSNYVGFGNAETDALIDSIKYTMDDPQRFAMVKRLQKIVYDEQPYIFLYSASRKNVIHKRFGNQYMTFDRPGVVTELSPFAFFIWSRNRQFHKRNRYAMMKGRILTRPLL